MEELITEQTLLHSELCSHSLEVAWNLPVLCHEEHRKRVSPVKQDSWSSHIPDLLGLGLVTHILSLCC